MGLLDWIGNQSLGRLILLGGILRIILLLYSVYHDHTFRVKYTDIDYMIISDGAAEMWLGGSPFSRTTFRYTPLLSVLMIPNYWFLPAGKILFAASDLGCAYMAYGILRTFSPSEASAKKAIAAFILFNPIVVNVSTRGNSDMVITFLSLLVMISYFKRRYIQAALWLGFAIHFKMYPIIYAAPLVFGLLQEYVLGGGGADDDQSSNDSRGESGKVRTVRKFTPRYGKFISTVVLCGVATVVSFVIPTFVCYLWYKQEYLDEALLYHLTREDHRHNFSMYWYHMYLNMARRNIENGAKSVYDSNLIAFVPQMIMLCFVAWRLRRNIAHACCIQTILFVAFNKVCTVQYFVWFLPLFPFIVAPFFEPRRARAKSRPATESSDARRLESMTSIFKIFAMFAFWFSSIVVWMLTAVELEFNGNYWWKQVWCASLYFFVCQISLAVWLGRIATVAQRVSNQDASKKVM